MPSSNMRLNPAYLSYYMAGLGEISRPEFAPIQAIYDLQEGKEGAMLKVVGWTAAQAALIGAGLFLGGDRSFKSVAIKSVIASVIVQGAAITYIQLQDRKIIKAEAASGT